MFRAGLQDPDQIAANLFPKQADANRSIFYEQGKPRTIREVYRALVAKHNAPASGFAAQQMSGQGPVAARESEPPLPSRFSPENMSFTGLFKNEVEAETGPAGGAAFFTQLYSQ